jgi:hypothetical protein
MKAPNALIVRAVIAGAALATSAIYIAWLAEGKPEGYDPRVYAKRLEALIVF